MKTQWRAKPTPDSETVASLSKELNLSPELGSILVQRGIDTYDKAQAFFRPKLSHLHDPFLMKDMDKAVKRIRQAVQNKESMLVYGDYDVDGTTAVSLVYSYFKNFNQNIEYYIPDRYKEGYGISLAGIEYAHQNNFKLIIALDCGIRSNELVAKAAELGVEFIICDHHLPGETVPPATAILNPKQYDCTYPYKELSGAGIGFKLIQAYTEKEGLPYETIMDYLDLVAVSIASDMVDVRGENRVLAYYGLKKLNENPSIGIQALLQDAQPGKTFSMMDIVFGIGPKINAAGRIADAKSAVKVLIERDYNTAKKFAVVLNERNHERKGLDTDITKEAVEQVENNAEFHQQQSIVLRGDDWHKGVIGIVASRMVEQFYKPTIVFSENEGMLTGSARSVRGFDIHEAIGKCSQYVAQFGGHKYAAGLSVPIENYDGFKAAFEKVVNETIEAESLVPVVEYDLELDPSRVSLKMVNILNQMAPFGPGNHMPVFRLNKIKSQGTARILKEKHLKLSMGQAPYFFDSIGFGMAELSSYVKPGNSFDACVSLEENHFNGRTNLQLKLRDIKSAEA